MEIRDDIFEDCNTKEQIMERILSFSPGSDDSRVSRLAAKKFLEIGEIDLSAKFYLSSKTQKLQENIDLSQAVLISIGAGIFLIILLTMKL